MEINKRLNWLALANLVQLFIQNLATDQEGQFVFPINAQRGWLNSYTLSSISLAIEIPLIVCYIFPLSLWQRLHSPFFLINNKTTLIHTAYAPMCLKFKQFQPKPRRAILACKTKRKWLTSCYARHMARHIRFTNDLQDKTWVYCRTFG